MSKFVKYGTSVDGLELIINQQTGEVYASQRATARMCCCAESTLRDFLGARDFALKEAQVITGGGIQGARLLNEDQIFECLAKYNPQLLLQCAKVGVKVYLYGLAGYEVRPTLPKPPQPHAIYVARETLAERNPVKVPKGYWIVFHESCKLMIHIELVLKYPVEEFDLCNGSIGIHWAKYRLSLGRKRSEQKFLLEFPDRRNKQWVNMYPDDELVEFRNWLEDVYKVEFLPKYLAKKYPGQLALKGAK